jgi:hypothetical protein
MFTPPASQIQFIKDQFGYASMYIAAPIATNLDQHIENILKLQKPKEALIISADENDLQKKIQKAREEKADTLYVLHTLTRPDFKPLIHGTEIAAEELKMEFKGGKVTYANEAKKAELDALVKAKKQKPTEELYEEAAKHSLGIPFRVSHRVCIKIDLNQNKVNYKDSFGKPIPPALGAMLSKTLNIPDSGITSDEQKQQHNEDHSNCPFFSLRNLLSFKNNEPMISPSITDYVPTLQALRKAFAQEVQLEIQKIVDTKGKYNASGELVLPAPTATNSPSPAKK